MDRIKITPDLNYKIELDGEFYYPAMLEADFDEKGKADLSKQSIVRGTTYVPLNGNTLQLISIQFYPLQLKQLSFQNIETEPPKIFIHKNLTNKFKSKNFISSIIPSEIKNATEIENYNEYFEMFREERLFSK
jgi:hypothetical protein